MSLTSTNTYVEPTAGTALNTARLQQNDNFRSLLSNFRSTSAPTSVNLSASGNPLSIPDGMLYRSATTNALYIADSVNKKTARVGGNFTRVGIGTRLEDSYEGLTANAATYEIGELVIIASADTGQTKHGSLHICAANAGAITDFIEIGAPLPVTTDLNDNVTFTGQAIVAPIVRTTANVGIRTDAPAQDLHVVGNALITTNVIIGEYVAHSGDLNTYIGFPANDTYVVYTNGIKSLEALSNGEVAFTKSIRVSADNTTGGGIIFSDDGDIVDLNDNFCSMRFTSGVRVYSTNKGGNTVITLANTGTISATGDVIAFSSSDKSLKENVFEIKNALHKVSQIRGVEFDWTDSYITSRGGEDNYFVIKHDVGVIAQEVQAVLPEIVRERIDGTLGVEYPKLVALLIEAIKELKIEIDQLKGVY